MGVCRNLKAPPHPLKNMENTKLIIIMVGYRYENIWVSKLLLFSLIHILIRKNLQKWIFLCRVVRTKTVVSSWGITHTHIHTINKINFLQWPANLGYCLISSSFFLGESTKGHMEYQFLPVPFPPPNSLSFPYSQTRRSPPTSWPLKIHLPSLRY